MNDSLNRLTEQIAAANQYRFGRHSEKMNDFNGQLSIFDLLNEAEYTVETASAPHEPDAEWSYVKFSDKLNATFFTVIQPVPCLIFAFDPEISSHTDPGTDIHNDCAHGSCCKTY